MSGSLLSDAGRGVAPDVNPYRWICGCPPALDADKPRRMEIIVLETLRPRQAFKALLHTASVERGLSCV